MNKLISIIIPTFNRAHLILHTLESIKNQTYNEWECIIVDDGSTDNTEDVLKKYIDTDSRFRYFKRPLNHTKGPSSCRNFGFYIIVAINIGRRIGDILSMTKSDFDNGYKDFREQKTKKVTSCLLYTSPSPRDS